MLPRRQNPFRACENQTFGTLVNWYRRIITATFSKYFACTWQLHTSCDSSIIGANHRQRERIDPLLCPILKNFERRQRLLFVIMESRIEFQIFISFWWYYTSAAVKISWEFSSQQRCIETAKVHSLFIGHMGTHSSFYNTFGWCICHGKSSLPAIHYRFRCARKLIERVSAFRSKTTWKRESTALRFNIFAWDNRVDSLNAFDTVKWH